MGTTGPTGHLGTGSLKGWVEWDNIRHHFGDLLLSHKLGDHVPHHLPLHNNRGDHLPLHNNHGDNLPHNLNNHLPPPQSLHNNHNHHHNSPEFPITNTFQFHLECHHHILPHHPSIPGLNHLPLADRTPLAV